MDIFTVLPNVGIGLAAVISLVYVTREFISHLKGVHSEHMQELKEREIAMREVEKEVRLTITNQLSKNTQVIERAMYFLDGKSK